MPVVPFRGPAPEPQTNPIIPVSGSKPDDTFLMMAAAQMAQEGKFKDTKDVVKGTDIKSTRR